MTHPIAYPSKKASIMALIICPECDGTVSDKASACVHCGYPLHGGSTVQATRTGSGTQSQHFCTACGAALPHRVRFCTSCGAPVGTPGPSAVSQPVQTRQAPAQPLAPASPMPPAPKQKEPEVLKCPKCGSTLVTTGERGYSIIWGFMGAGSTVNRCGKCGFMWKPY